jgi:hypothetical protein
MSCTDFKVRVQKSDTKGELTEMGAALQRFATDTTRRVTTLGRPMANPTS